MARRNRSVLPPTAKDAPPSLVAPAPLIDRNPTVVGSAVTLAYISRVMRDATAGEREEWVDLLNELLERDPHTYSVVSKRILMVAGGRVEITPAITEENDPDFAKAEEIAQFVAKQVDAIHDLPTAIALLLWGIFYGISAQEIVWERTGTDWVAVGLEFIHPRRLDYPDADSWDLYISMDRERWTGASLDGVRVADFPGKFIVHSPRVRGDYPTREGIGRELGFWMALKGVAARAAVQYVEGYSRPRPIATYSTGADGKGRIATDKDIAAAKTVSEALGKGLLSSGVLPDSVVLNMLRVEGGITHDAFLAICNAEITKAALGNTGTTEIGKNGSRAQAETMHKDQQTLTRYDAISLAETLRRDLARPITLLNFAAWPHLVPRVVIHATEHPDPAAIMAVAEKAALIGMPLDADKLGAMTGMPLIAVDDEDARPLTPPGMAAAAEDDLEDEEDDEEAEPEGDAASVN